MSAHLSWVEPALNGSKRATAKLVSLFEDHRVDKLVDQAAVLAALDADDRARHATIIGITGTPGAGKSTLCGELAMRLVARSTSARAAVLAVDPSSAISGGALLGDRTRVRFPVGESRLYFRSQASDRELGGLSRASWPVVRVLSRLFDTLFIETVGVGQSEVEIQRVSDAVFLILQPMAGDRVQFMKAGIMEIPDVIVLNKCDEERAARRSYHSLRASLSLARPDGDEVPVLRTSALTGLGIDEVVDAIEAVAAPDAVARIREREEWFFERWIRAEFGRNGLARFKQSAESTRSWIESHNGYELAVLAAHEQMSMSAFSQD